MATKPQQLNERPHCSKCGLEINQHVGMCAGCVLKVAVESLSANDHPALGPIAIRGRCPTVESLNKQFNDFEFVELLGQGGSGWTFLATQTRLARNVAVKLISRCESRQNELERFEKEAGNLAKLNHANIITVHDFGVTEQFLYIVMEYVPNLTLRRWVFNGLDSEQVCGIGSQICRALEVAHESGLVHRDVKPENILVVRSEPEFEIRVADFGISRLSQGNLVESDSGGGLTATGLIVGTPFYMSPEQQVAGRTIDRRADVYSTGVVLYELLTGQLPQGNFAPPSNFGRCDSALDAVLMKALSNDPNDRFETANEFGNRLETMGAPGSEKSRSKWALPVLVLLGLGLLLLATFGLSRAFQRGSGDLADGATTYTESNLSQETPVQKTPERKQLPKRIEETSENAEQKVVPKQIEETSPRAVDVAPELEEGEKEKEEDRAIPLVYQKLLDEISSNDFRKIRSALSSLKDVPPDPEIEPITERVIQLTLDTNYFVSTQALETLAVLNYEEGLKALTEAMGNGIRSRSSAIKILDNLADARYIPVLANELGSRDFHRILSALKKIGPQSESALQTHIKRDQGWMVMKPAIEALGDIGTDDSLALLESLETSQEPFVGDAATNAIAAIKARLNQESTER